MICKHCEAEMLDATTRADKTQKFLCGTIGCKDFGKPKIKMKKQKGSPAKIMANQLIFDLENRPEDFECGSHYLEDKKTGCGYWVANGWICFTMEHPSKFDFGIFHTWRIWRAFKLWRATSFVNESQKEASVEKG